MTDQSLEDPNGHVERLHRALADVVAEPLLPRVLVLHGESGRGKTFAVQRFYDELAASNPGYWRPGLAPKWPPTSLRDLRRSRKRTAATVEPAPTLANPPFLWMALSSQPDNPGTGRNSATLVEQEISQSFLPSVASRRREREVSREAAALAADAVGLLAPPVGFARTALSHGKAMYQLSKEDPDWLLSSRRRINGAYNIWARARPKPVPVIAVLDDAANANFETFFLLSGLIAPDVTDELAMAASANRFLPRPLTVTSPAPLLIICTTWEHRFGAAYINSFQRWLGEVDQLGLDVAWERCGELAREGASELLHRWDPQAPARRILSHIERQTGPTTVVNPLVLAECIGRLELHRDPFSGTLEVTDKMLASLPTTPEQQTQERLLSLRQDPSSGRHAYAILALAAHLSPMLPDRLLTELATVVGDEAVVAEAGETLERHVLAWHMGLPGAENSQRDQLSAATLDPDAQRLLALQAITPSQANTLLHVSRGLLHWCCAELLPAELDRPPCVPWSLLVATLGPAASFVLAAEAADDHDARLIARTLLGSDDECVVECCSSVVRAFAYAHGAADSALEDADLLAACRHFAASRTSAAIARRRFLTWGTTVTESDVSAFRAVLWPWSQHYSIASALASIDERAGRIDSAIAVIRPVANHNPGGSFKLAELLLRRRDIDEAVAVLRPIAGQLEQAATRLAELLEDQGRDDEAIDVLRPVSDRFEQAAVKLADILIRNRSVDEAIAALQPLVGHSVPAAMKLAQILVAADRADDAVRLLGPLAARSGNVAVRVVELLDRHNRKDQAISLLRPLAQNSAPAAMKLADLLVGSNRVDDAIEVLRPTSLRSGLVAVKLARLLEEAERVDDAIVLLRDASDGSESAAKALADLLVRRKSAHEAIVLLLPLSTSSQSAAMRLAELFVASARFDDAIDCLLPLCDSSQPVAVALAELLVRQDDADRAIAVLKGGRQAFGPATAKLANILVSRGDTEQAISVLAPFARTHDPAAVGVVELLMRRGLTKEAIETVRMGDRFEQTAVRLAGLMKTKGRIEDAIAILTPLAGRSSQAATSLASLLVGAGRAEAAVAILRPLAGRFEQAATALASLLNQQGRVGDAIAVLEPSINRSQPARLMTADLLESSGHIDEAVELLRPLVFESDQAVTKLAGLLLRHNRIDEALILLEPVADRFEQAAIKLAAILVTQDRLDDAIAVLKPAARRFEQAAVRLSVLLERQGRTDDAIATLQLIAGSEQAVVKLATLLEKQGRTDDAIAALQRNAGTSEQVVLRLATLLEKLGRTEDAIATLQRKAATSEQATKRLTSLRTHDRRRSG